MSTMDKVNVVGMIESATALETSDTFEPWQKDRTFQAIGTVTGGAGSATIEIHASNDGSNWITMGTISLSIADSSTPDTDGFSSSAAWRYIRAELTAITGTGASVDVIMGAR